MRQRKLATFIAALLACLLGTTPGLANEYFWPSQHQDRNFKVKAHAIRGSVRMTPGETVKIGASEYREILMSPQPERLPEHQQAIYIRADAKGLYSRHSTNEDAQEVLELALPIEVGKTWQTYDHLGNPSERTIEAVADCNIHKQLFKDCVKVSFQAPGGSAVAFYAPGHGEIVNSRKNGFMRREIIESVN